MIELATPLSEMHGVGKMFLTKLKRLHVETVRDLLWYFPVRYEDYSTIYQVADLTPGQHATVQGVVEGVKTRHTWQRHMSIVEATVRDETGEIRVVWFNQPYIANSLKRGNFINLSGKITEDEDGTLYFSHPTFEKVKTLSSPQAPTHTARLVPIYAETRGLTSKGIRFLVQSFLRHIDFPEWIPEKILSDHKLPAVTEALRTIHFPSAIEQVDAARKRFSFEELFLLQIANLLQKQALRETKAARIVTDIEWLKGVLAGLPFALTETQKRSLWEIIKDIGAPHPMNRLLQGDVGSGKTVVAALAALITAKMGFQAAFMAPTEVLARQHYKTLTALFKDITKENQAPIALLTGSEAKIFYETDVEANVKKPDLVTKIGKGEVAIVIGTHALIQKSVAFHKLGFVVVDEQHRFGVKQRQALLQGGVHIKKSAVDFAPHFLSMSATPIPRTIMMTVFGDLESSLITELPSGRKEIITSIVPPVERKKSYEFIRAKVKEGRQVFVICPRIEIANEEERKVNETNQKSWSDVKAVKEEFEKLSKKIFPDFKVEMLHGKMKSKEKEDVMKRFKANEIHILVSTSVIEVGVDIPNAAIMMIEGAERFGLAQLYQFRGRVGRGEHQSYCLLFTDSDTKSTKARLKAVLEAKNGFELAERDLKLRGPGQFLGESQTGLPDVAMQGIQNPELVKSSRDAALTVVEEDPSLSSYPLLTERLAEFKSRIHLE